MSAKLPAEPTSRTMRHKIGCARTVRTAVMVCAYLNQRNRHLSSDRFRYVFTEAVGLNGFWLADIICDTYGDEDFDKLFPCAVQECRAFVAGAGEVWT